MLVLITSVSSELQAQTSLRIFPDSPEPLPLAYTKYGINEDSDQN